MAASTLPAVVVSGQRYPSKETTAASPATAANVLDFEGRKRFARVPDSPHVRRLRPGQKAVLQPCSCLLTRRQESVSPTCGRSPTWQGCRCGTLACRLPGVISGLRLALLEPDPNSQDPQASLSQSKARPHLGPASLLQPNNLSRPHRRKCGGTGIWPDRDIAGGCGMVARRAALCRPHRVTPAGKAGALTTNDKFPTRHRLAGGAKGIRTLGPAAK